MFRSTDGLLCRAKRSEACPPPRAPKIAFPRTAKKNGRPAARVAGSQASDFVELRKAMAAARAPAPSSGASPKPPRAPKITFPRTAKKKIDRAAAQQPGFFSPYPLLMRFWSWCVSRGALRCVRDALRARALRDALRARALRAAAPRT